MRNTGLRNPARSALICLAMFVGGAVSVMSVILAAIAGCSLCKASGNKLSAIRARPEA